MRRLGTATTVILAAGLAVTLTACGPASSVKTAADKTTAAAATAAAGAKAKAKPAPKATKPPVAHVGDTITLHGMDSGSKLAVTLVKWVPLAHGADEFTTPSAGKRFAAAQFRIVNTGTAVYSDSPSNGVQVADADGQRFDSTFGDVNSGPSMASQVDLKPGGKALGYVTFEVPRASKVASVQFTMDSGFADEAGEWTIG